MQEIEQNCVTMQCPKIICGRSSAQDPVGGAWTLPTLTSRLPLFPSTHSASHFVVFGDSSPMCPSQNNFLDPPLATAAYIPITTAINMQASSHNTCTLQPITAYRSVDGISPLTERAPDDRHHGRGAAHFLASCNV